MQKLYWTIGLAVATVVGLAGLSTGPAMAQPLPAVADTSYEGTPFDLPQPPPEERSATRAEHWREMRQHKARTMEPAKDNFVKRAVDFAARNGSYIVPNQLIIDVGNLDVLGIRPVLGGMGSHSGLTGGLWYEPAIGDRIDCYSNIQLLASLRGYYGMDAVFGHENGAFINYVYGRYYHQPGERFYGIGPDAARVEAVYRLNEGVFGTLAGASLGSNVMAGGHLTYEFNRYGPGEYSDWPTASTAFADASVPGIGMDVDHLVSGGFFEYDTRDIPYLRAYGRRFAPTEDRLRGVSLDATQGFYFATQLSHYQDVSGNRASFTRLSFDVQEYISIDPSMHQVVVLRQFLSLTRPLSGNTVPFYNMQTLGGSNALRGYTTGRFRDLNAALLNAEVRCKIWHWLDMAVFMDAGHVFRTADELGFDNIETGYGVGFRLRSDDQVQARFEIARSPEGISTSLSLGSLL